jgi:hypothetical protein
MRVGGRNVRRRGQTDCGRGEKSVSQEKQLGEKSPKVARGQMESERKRNDACKEGELVCPKTVLENKMWCS